MVVLGIESSCDETSAAVVKDGRDLLSNIVSSQIAVHKPYGGVVPELASRHHISNIVPVVEEALREANESLDTINGIAATCGPGLVGSLLVGLQFAKAVAYAKNLPLVGVNHLEGHLTAPWLVPGEPPPERHVALLVSGGHTQLILVEKFGSYRLLGSTRDDAAGEAFDKVAKLLGLGYPGGPIVESLAKTGKPDAYSFPRAMPQKTSLEFSFSGLKTSVLTVVKKEGVPTGTSLNNLCASFQQAVCDVLVKKTVRAAKTQNVSGVVASGGVMANHTIRKSLGDALSSIGVQLFLPPLNLCTDNAAMIAAAGCRRIEMGERASLDLNASARLPLVFRPAAK